MTKDLTDIAKDSNRTFIDPNAVRVELEKIGLANLAKCTFSYHQFVRGGEKFNIPTFDVSDFEDLLHGMVSIQKSEHPKRHFVALYEDGVIKSPRKREYVAGWTRLVHDGEAGDRASIAATEYVDTNLLAPGRSSKEMPVVGIICLIKNINPKRNVETGRFYLVEKRFQPMPNVGGELKEDYFANREDFLRAKNAYASFVKDLRQRGRRYIPIDSDRPYADLVLKVKKDGSARVLATDWPFFRNLAR